MIFQYMPNLIQYLFSKVIHIRIPSSFEYMLPVQPHSLDDDGYDYYYDDNNNNVNNW
jgi:hypothetical protein